MSREIHLTEHYFDNLLPLKLVNYTNRLVRASCTTEDQLKRISDLIDMKPYEKQQ